MSPVFQHLGSKNIEEDRKILKGHTNLQFQIPKANTLKAATGLENRYRHTNPLESINQNFSLAGYVQVSEKKIHHKM